MEQLLGVTVWSRSLPIWARYMAATALVLVAFALRRVVFGPGPGMPFLFFFPAVIVSAIGFDRGTGIYSSLLSAAIAVWFFVDPVGAPELAHANDLLALFVYLATSLLCAVLLEALHVALARGVTQRAALTAANAELRKLAEEKGVLLGEAVHRARNDLQRLSATLTLQARAANEAGAREALGEAAERISALARINERLDRHKDDGMPEVDSRGFIEGLVEDLRDGAVGLRPIALVVNAESHTLPMARAVPIGLVLNELVGNALKYAFPDDLAGQISIALQAEGGDYILSVEDNGVGFDPAAPALGTGLGARLSRAFAAQLGGTLAVAPANPGAPRPGVRWTVRFPVAGLT